MPVWKGIVGRGFTAADFEQYVQTIQLTAWRPQFIVLHNTFIPRLAGLRARHPIRELLLPADLSKLNLMKPLVSLANHFTSELLISSVSSLVRKARLGMHPNSSQTVRRVQKKAES